MPSLLLWSDDDDRILLETIPQVRVARVEREFAACRKRTDDERDRQTLAVPVGDVAGIVAATLRTVAQWIPDDKDSDLLHSTADQVERDGGPNSICCPLCEEVTCDGGCPMEVVRQPVAESTGARKPDESARAGYDQAVATLRDVADRTGSDAAAWAAAYLEADPDRLAPARQ